jgi:hypothetical protein
MLGAEIDPSVLTAAERPLVLPDHDCAPAPARGPPAGRSRQLCVSMVRAALMRTSRASSVLARSWSAPASVRGGWAHRARRLSSPARGAVGGCCRGSAPRLGSPGGTLLRRRRQR